MSWNRDDLRKDLSGNASFSLLPMRDTAKALPNRLTTTQPFFKPFTEESGTMTATIAEPQTQPRPPALPASEDFHRRSRHVFAADIYSGAVNISVLPADEHDKAAQQQLAAEFDSRFLPEFQSNPVLKEFSERKAALDIDGGSLERLRAAKVNADKSVTLAISERAKGTADADSIKLARKAATDAQAEVNDMAAVVEQETRELETLANRIRSFHANQIGESCKVLQCEALMERDTLVNRLEDLFDEHGIKTLMRQLAVAQRRVELAGGDTDERGRHMLANGISTICSHSEFFRAVDRISPQKTQPPYGGLEPQFDVHVKPGLGDFEVRPPNAPNLAHRLVPTETLIK